MSRCGGSPLARFYPSLVAATDETNKIATSQLALPEATCDDVYATSGYEDSITTLQ